MTAPHSAPISVVIPAHNEERFIEAAIRSVLDQTCPVAEIIVVADACTDRTATIAETLGTVVLRHANRNMSMGLNLGVKAATQPFIAFLDADDYWHPEKIQCQWQGLSDFPAAALSFCDASMVIDDVIAPPPRHLESRWAGVSLAERQDRLSFIERVSGQFLIDFFLATAAAVVRRDVFAELGGFDESLLFGQTLEFFARALARHSMIFVERPLAFYRRHDRNHTNKLEQYRPVYISIINRMLKHPEIYPPGAGAAFRERFKRDFHSFERGLARAKR